MNTPLIFAAVSVLLQVFVPYRRYAPILKFLTLVLFLYVAVAFTVEIPWRDVLVASVLPTVSFKYEYLLLVVAVLGTTISPYLFFWQASQEVEEMRKVIIFNLVYKPGATDSKTEDMPSVLKSAG